MTLLLALWVALPARADDLPEIALLPFDAAPNTDTQAMRVISRGVAAALDAEGRLRPVVDNELEARLTEDHVDRLGEARDALSEGRRLLTAGDPAFAVVFLEESVAAYGDAGGSYAHRQEQADAWFALARAFSDLGDVGQAAQALSRALTLVPDHLQASADAYDPTISALAADVTTTLTVLPASHLSPAAAQEIARKVDAPYLVEGVVGRDGALQLTVYASGASLHTVSRPGPLTPGRIGDPYYAGIADELAAACFGQPIPEVAVVRPVRPLSTARPERRKGRWVAPVLGGIVAAGTASVVVAATWPDPPTAVTSWSLVVTGP